MSGLLQETRGTVRLLRFDNPARRNALSPALRMELLRALEAAECDPSIRSVLLTGGEEVFCAGGDLGDMRVTELAAGRARMQDNARLVRQMVRMGKPLIAAVEGWAVGAGLSVALACDSIVCGAGARFAAGFGKVGLLADLGQLHTLPARIGWGAGTADPDVRPGGRGRGGTAHRPGGPPLRRWRRLGDGAGAGRAGGAAGAVAPGDDQGVARRGP